MGIGLGGAILQYQSVGKTEVSNYGDKMVLGQRPLWNRDRLPHSRHCLPGLMQLQADVGESRRTIRCWLGWRITRGIPPRCAQCIDVATKFRSWPKAEIAEPDSWF